MILKSFFLETVLNWTNLSVVAQELILSVVNVKMDTQYIFIHLASYANQQSQLGWLFYILSEFLPVTVVFITVLVLNISFTSGAVNGFILFGQLLASLDLKAAGIITFPLKALKNASQGYQIFYGFFNLDYVYFNLVILPMERCLSIGHVSY